MAADCTDGDYLGAYSRFFAEFLARVNPHDQLPVTVSGYDITENELVGEIINITLQYLNQTHCPSSLQAHIVHQVIQEIKSMCKKQPEDCGLRPQEKTYAPLKLMQAVTSKVNEICTRYLDNSRLALLPPPHSTPLPEVVAGGNKNCPRKMEDRYVVLHDLHTTFSIQDDSVANYYAVFDGHGGQDAAIYCASHLHQYLAESKYYPTDPERAFRDAFLTTDAQFIEKTKTQRVSGGTTAVCTLLLNKKLYVAWAGDSLAMLVKPHQITQLVSPHRLTRSDEMQRIQSMGGIVVQTNGTMRVSGILSVSRAIGDVSLKPFVTGEPEVKCVDLDGTEDFIIVASDGLWDFVTADEAATIVYEEIRRHPKTLKCMQQLLVQRAKKSGSQDNITVIVILLKPAVEIAARAQNANLNCRPAPNDLLNNMDPMNPFLSNANGRHDATNGAFIKQIPQLLRHQEQQEHEEQMDDNHIMYETSSNGKHENGDADYDYSDLGPETDVDAIDDPPMPVKNLSYELFPDDKHDSSDDEDEEDKDSNVDLSRENNEMNVDHDMDIEHDSCGNQVHIDNNILKDHKEIHGNDTVDVDDKVSLKDDALVDVQVDDARDVVDDAAPVDYDDSPPSLQATKPLQHALIPEADNVADSEDSEDEWNYYRVDPNKEEDSTASVDGPQEQKNESTPQSPDSSVEDRPDSQSPEIELDTKCDSPKEEVVSELINTEISTEEKLVESEGVKSLTEDNETLDIMDFQLNPDAEEFVPGTPNMSGTRLNLVKDCIISGSPLKQVPPMNDIQVPSENEFDEEVCLRPSERDNEKECTNGDHIEPTDYTDFMTDRQKCPIIPVNLDDSEISSTKAECGDESVSFMTASDFHRTGISAVDESFSSSERDYDIAKDPMAMSFTPSDFEAAFDTVVDLNAVHDLSNTDLNEKNGTMEDDDMIPRFAEVHPELTALASPETEQPSHTPAFPGADPTEFVKISSPNYDDVEPTLIVHDEPVKTDLPEAQSEDKSSEIDYLAEHDICKSEHSPLTDNYSAEFGSEKEPVSVDNEQVLSPSSVDVDETKPLDETSENTGLFGFDLQKDTHTVDAETTSSLSSAPDALECKSPEKQNELISPMENLELSPAPVPELTPDQCPFNAYPSECMVTSTTLAPMEDSDVREHTQSALLDELMEPIPEPVSATEATLQEVKENLLDLTQEPGHEIHTKIVKMSNEHVKGDVTPPSSPQKVEETISKATDELVCPITPRVEDKNLIETDEIIEKMEVCDLEAAKEEIIEAPREPEVVEAPVRATALNLSESMQEFTGLEKQLQPEETIKDAAPVESPLVEIDPQPVKEDTTEQKELLVTVAEETNKAEEPKVIPEEIPEIKESKVEPVLDALEKEVKEPVVDALEKEVKEPVVDALEKEVKEPVVTPAAVETVVAAAAAATVATAAAGAVTAATQSKIKAKLAPKPTKTALSKAPTKSTPTSPSKMPSATARSSATTMRKSVPVTATRPKELDTAKKAPVSSTIGKTSTLKPATSTKSTTTMAAKTTNRMSIGAPKPKPTTASLKSTLSTTDKKPTANGDVKPLSKPTTAKSSQRPTASSTSKAGPIKSTTIRPPVGSAAPKPRPTTAAPTAKTSLKQSSTTTSSATTAATRPKTAPPTSSTLKSRTAAGKSPVIDKQIKETANKQISLARAPTATASKTTRTAITSTATSSTVKRPSTARSTVSSSSPIKKSTTSSKTTKTLTGTKSTISGKVKVVPNGFSETTEITSTVITTNDKHGDDVPKKDLSPVMAPTDNQLLISSD